MEYDFDDIDDYLNGQMSESDRTKFEAAMQADPTLADDVEAQRAAEGVLFAMRVEALKEKMDRWDNGQTGGAPSSEPTEISLNGNYTNTARRSGRYVGLLALLLLVGLGVWKWSFGSGNQGEKPKSTQPRDTPFIVPPPIVPPSPAIATQWPDLYRDITLSSGLMGGGDAGDSTDYLSQAEALYKQKHYEEALTLLATPDSSQIDKYVWLLAHLYYKLKIYNLAEQNFRSAQQYTRLRMDAERGELACLIQQMPRSRARLEKRLADGVGKRLADEEMSKLKEVLRGER